VGTGSALIRYTALQSFFRHPIFSGSRSGCTGGAAGSFEEVPENQLN
jgi:hypothetical protein